MSFPLSLLDLSLIDEGVGASQALHNSVAAAQRAEALGFERIWFAEHHSSASIASASPELMIARASAATTRIRVGSGGIMLPNHPPLKVVEVFRALEAFAPGRIDLGIGRAPGTDSVTAFALRRSAEAMGAEDFPSLLAELLAFAEGGFPDDHPFRTIQAVPVDVALPPIWLLGSSGYSAALAAELGLGFAFASHINFPAAVPMVRAYRERFRPAGRFVAPHAILAVSVVCGEDDAHADDLAASLDLVGIGLRTGKLRPISPPAVARAYPFTESEREMARSYRASHLIGGPARVRHELEHLVEACGADEAMLLTMVHGHNERMAVLARVQGAFAASRSEGRLVAAGAA